jgi:hypothetical protein
MADLVYQGYLGTIPFNDSSYFVGDTNVSLQIADFPYPISTASLVFWLDGKTFVTGNNWIPTFGNATGSMTGATPVKASPSNGGVVNFTTSSAMVITSPNSLNFTASAYTVFVATRYSGSSSDRHGRLLDARNNNWLFPTYGGGGGGGVTTYSSAWYNTTDFIIASGSIYDTEWRISTGVRDTTNLSASFFLNGNFVLSASNDATTRGFDGLSINDGFYTDGTVNPGGDEVTQADVGDIILYDRVLSNAEIQNVTNVLKGRYGI